MEMNFLSGGGEEINLEKEKFKTTDEHANGKWNVIALSENRFRIDGIE